MKNFCLTLIILYNLIFMGCASKTGKSLNLQPEKDLNNKNTADIQKSIQNKFQSKDADFNSCFLAERENSKERDNPPLKKLMSLVTLEKDGDIRASDIISTRPVSEEFRKCINSVISSIEFEPIGYDEPVLIFYPLEHN